MTRNLLIDEIEYDRVTVKQFQLMQHRKPKFVFEALNAALDQTDECIADISLLILTTNVKN